MNNCVQVGCFFFFFHFIGINTWKCNFWAIYGKCMCSILLRLRVSQAFPRVTIHSHQQYIREPDSPHLPSLYYCRYVYFSCSYSDIELFYMLTFTIGI